MIHPNDGTEPAIGPAELVEAGVVARRYYLERKGKKEIAEELGISRFKVARILDRAVEHGLVNISINAPAQIDLELSDRLQKAYTLRRAVVVVAGEGPDLRRDLGLVAANLLSEVVTADDVVGIAWGRTLDAMTASLSSIAPCTVVQITGVAGSDSVELIRRTAAVSGGPVYQFFVPLVLPDARTARSLREQPDLAAAMSRYPSISVAVMAVGSWDPPESQLRNALSETDRKELEQLGIVAEICAVFLDEEGRTMSSDIESRCISISAEQLRSVPELIAVAGGHNKVRAIRAVLRGGYATTLVTDAVAARGLLDG